MMNNAFDEVRAQVRLAKEQFEAVDAVASNMAALLVGRLRQVNAYHLKSLKRELRDFDINRSAWKKR